MAGGGVLLALSLVVLVLGAGCGGWRANRADIDRDDEYRAAGDA